MGTADVSGMNSRVFVVPGKIKTSFFVSVLSRTKSLRDIKQRMN